MAKFRFGDLISDSLSLSEYAVDKRTCGYASRFIVRAGERVVYRVAQFHLIRGYAFLYLKHVRTGVVEDRVTSVADIPLENVVPRSASFPLNLKQVSRYAV
jgi:hypothetical protein